MMRVDDEDTDSVPMTVDEYVTLVAHLPPPTDLQIRQFADFVSGAHSWYKHIQLLPPGLPFQFYIDPGASMDLEMQTGGALVAAERMARGFHYSTLATAQYRMRFGYLTYVQHVGVVLAKNGILVKPVVHPDCLVFDQQAAKKRLVPVDVYEAGQSLASGLIHPICADPRALFWAQVLHRESDLRPRNGDSTALELIRARCLDVITRVRAAQLAAIRDSDGQQDALLKAAERDARVVAALEQERERQRSGMIAAMQRVTKIAYAVRGREGTDAASLH
jgi:hypothetical protein